MVPYAIVLVVYAFILPPLAVVCYWRFPRWQRVFDGLTGGTVICLLLAWLAVIIAWGLYVDTHPPQDVQRIQRMALIMTAAAVGYTAYVAGFLCLGICVDRARRRISTE